MISQHADLNFRPLIKLIVNVLNQGLCIGRSDPSWSAAAGAHQSTGRPPGVCSQCRLPLGSIMWLRSGFARAAAPTLIPASCVCSAWSFAANLCITYQCLN